MPSTERDYPVGHPSSGDYVPGSPEALAWIEQNVKLKGEEDYPPGHPARGDHPDRKDFSRPAETVRDFSRPHTIPKNEFEAVTGESHSEAVRLHQEREQERVKKEQAKREAMSRRGA